MLLINIKKKLFSESGEKTLAINAEIGDNKFLAIYGKSGAGKTTLLKILAGLIKPDDGQIIVDDEVWFDSKKNIDIEPKNRRIGYVFQEYNLFPNMSVRQNIEIGCRGKTEARQIDKFLELSELKMIQNVKSSMLSGGQQQRVALIRALVSNPKILLLDEPLSSLETLMRSKLQDLILQLYNKDPLYTFLVSHDISEVYKMAQKVMVLDEGKMTKEGEPDEVFASRSLSNKFSFAGDVVAIKKADVVNIVTVRVGTSISRIVAIDEEIENIKIGDTVVLASKAFNPVMLKVKI